MKKTVYHCRIMKLDDPKSPNRGFGFNTAEDRQEFRTYAKQKGWAVIEMSEPATYSLDAAKARLDSMLDPGPEEAAALAAFQAKLNADTP